MKLAPALLPFLVVIDGLNIFVHGTNSECICPDGRPKIEVDGIAFQELIGACLAGEVFCEDDLGYPDIPLNCWDVSLVTNMASAFAFETGFNEPLNCWDVSNVNKMEGMFGGRTSGPHAFNQPLDNWNVSNVQGMEAMFAKATDFDQPLNSWDVESVVSFRYMFSGASTFNQCLSTWAKPDGEFAYTNNMLKNTSCPNKLASSRESPWCQTQADRCPCEDSPDFVFTFYNKKGEPKIKGGCDHVAKRRKKRCKKTIDGQKVKNECCSTCRKE